MDIMIDKAIAWLEKQGEQILANSAQTCKDEQKPAEWSDKDEENIQHCIGAIWAADFYLYEDKQEMENWLENLKDRIGG